MQPSQWELLVLKPAPAFLSFLSTQLPHVQLPEFRTLQTDNTGYVFQQQVGEAEWLDEIENHYVTMFKHEIERWLGRQIYQDAKASFLDFLCCFKFDIHSQILLMEEAVCDGRQMISVKPRTVLLKWIRSKLQEYPDPIVRAEMQETLVQWAEYGTVVIKNLEDVHDLKPFLKLHYDKIYAAEIQRFSESFIDWPEVDSYQMFCRYFAVELHTMLVHL